MKFKYYLPLFLLFFTLFMIQPATAQFYSAAFVADGGNPGGLNTGTDSESITSWNIILEASLAANQWSDTAAAIPFPFEFFGTPVTHFKVSGNGLVSFDTTVTGTPPNVNTNLPHSSLTDMTVAGMWDEFTSSPPTATNDRVVWKLYGTSPNQQLWIKWFSYEVGNPFVSFSYWSIVLEESSNKVYVVDMYSSTTPLLTTTVGLQENATTAVQFGDSLIAQAGNGSGNADNDYWEFFIPVADDIGASAIAAVFPGPIPYSGNTATIDVEVTNFGLNAASGFDVTYMVDDGSSATQAYVGTLNPGTSDTVTMTTQWTPAAGGTFQIMAYTTYASDLNTANDSTTASVDVVDVSALNLVQDFENYTGNPSTIGWYGADNQNFGSFIPSPTNDGAWTSDDFGNDPAISGDAARFNLYSASSTDQDWIITPPMDMTSGGANPMVAFDISVTPYTGTDTAFIPLGDTLFVAYSTDGLNWPRANILAQYTNADTIYPAGRRESIDITSLATEPNLWIGFLAMDLPDAEDINLYIDNVLVGVPPTLDMGPTALVSPFPGVIYTANEDVIVTVENFGPTTIDFSVDNMTINVDVAGASTQNFSTVVNTGTLDPDSTLDVLVTSSCDLTAAGQHDFTITTVVSGDGNPANDVLLASIVSQAVVSTFPYFEHFDSTTAGSPGVLPAGWQNVPDDDIDWFVESSGTGNSAGTGPLNDNSGTGNYMYVESSSPNFPDVIAHLHSPGFDISGLTNPALSFYFHMYGADMGELHVDVYDNGVWTLDAMPPLVGQYQTAETDPWIRTAVSLSGFTGPVLVRFRGITGAGFTSDMAVDDVTVGEAQFDVAAGMITMPKLTMTPLSQTGLVSNIPLEGLFSNIGGANTGDLNVEITDDMGTVVHSEALTGVSINGFSDSTFAFTPANAAGADSGQYDITMYAANFTGANLSNDTMMISHVLGDQMAFDYGVQSTSGTFSSTERSWFGVRYTLSDPDTLRNVKILVSASALATDSFAVEIWSVVNDSPDVALLSIYDGAYSDLGTLPALVSFDIPGGYVLPAGDFAIVFDMRNTNSFPCGIDYTAMGAQNIPNTFWGKLQSTAWLPFETVGAGTWTPIMRAGFNVPSMPSGPIFEEIFADTTIPAGWLVVDNDGSGFAWELVQQIAFTSGDTVNPEAGQSFWFSNFTNANPAGLIDEWIISPQIPANNFGRLQFYAGAIGGSYDDSLKVWVSTTGNNVNDFTDLLGYFRVDGPTGSWYPYEFDLTPYVGQNIYFAVNYYIVDGGPSGNYSDNVWVDHFLIDTMQVGGQTVEFFDDFESGTTNWTLEGGWGLTDQISYSPTHSLTESPVGNYPPSQNISATMATGVDLSAALDATVSFWARYNIEQGFDYMYVEVSANAGPWVQIAVFDGEGFDIFQEYSYSLGGFVGNPDVKVRFRFFSDGGYEVDGMYIDDFMITSTDVDNTPPLIVHAGPEFYEGTLEDFQVMTEIVDISGLASANVLYTVDGGSFNSLAPDSSSGNMYYFTIPMQTAGAGVNYWITATDNATNVDTVGIFSYISGNHLIYDNTVVDYVYQYLANQSVAVRMSLPAGSQADLVNALIRNYTDINRPNDTMMVHIWDDAGGLPGADLVTPFMVYPEATLTNTSPMTRVDLRPYSAQLSGLTGDFFIGFSVPAGVTNGIWLVGTSPTAFNRTYTNVGTGWVAAAQDHHFRAVIGDTTLVGITGGVDLIPEEFALYQNYPNPFNPTTTIKYALKQQADVTINIYNLLGQEVRTLVNSSQEAGYKTVVWDGLNNSGARVASGIYIYRIQAGDFVQARKMILMK